MDGHHQRRFRTIIMDNVNALFVVMTALFVAVPLLLRWTDARSWLPAAVARTYAYGKITGGGRPSGVLSVPKRWYRHFYWFAAALSGAACLVLLDAYTAGRSPWPAGAAWCGRRAWAPIRHGRPSYSAAAASAAALMLALQCARRAYETHRVNVFSDAAVGLWYYASGYAHYAGAVATVMAEAPAAAGPRFFAGPADACRLAVAAALFAWAYREQWRANVALAAARKRDGRVVTLEHRVVDGGLFRLVSSPQMFAEMVVYGALYVALWGGTGWKYVVAFVWGNQLLIGLATHRWYRDRFRNYPPRRKAIIPYLL